MLIPNQLPFLNQTENVGIEPTPALNRTALAKQRNKANIYLFSKIQISFIIFSIFSTFSQTIAVSCFDKIPNEKKVG